MKFGLPTLSQRPRRASFEPDPTSIDPAAARAALALIEAIVPGGGNCRRGDEDTLRVVAQLLEHTHPLLAPLWSKGAIALDHLAIGRTGHRFQSLSHERQQALIAQWSREPAVVPILQAFSLPVKLAHFDRKEVYEGLGGHYNEVKSLEPARWMSQVVDAATSEHEDEVECEVVVVGTGAGGAVVGRELVERGYAVVFVEEGRLIRRDEFTGSSIKAHQEFYRAAVSLGNTLMPVIVGRLVGGSTAVNGGTSFHTPAWVLDRWCERMGTDAFAPETMQGYIDHVERILQVEPANRRFIGKIQEIIARGCDAHGWSHFVIRRNAPGCEGSGFCDFGCRTDARRSTNISYVPPALEKGAMLYTHLRADRLILEGGRAVGVVGVTPRGQEIRVRGRAVVFSGGAIPTPLFLQRQGLCGSSGQLGKNLTLHPSGGLSAVFDEVIDGKSAIPQAYGCNEFVREGILITGAQPDVNYGPIVTPFLGDPLVELMNQMSYIAGFGAMIADEGTGRVVASRSGVAALHYRMTPGDVKRLHRATVLMGEIAWAAGAKRVLPAYTGGHDYRSRAAWKRFVDHTPRVSELLVTSYHPLGTCRMGKDPKTSVVGLDHEAHDVPGLFIVDGSTVEGPLYVNPQITIMAVATRAAEQIAEKLG